MTTSSGVTDEDIAAVEEQLGVLIAKFRSRIRKRVTLVHPELQPAGYQILSTLVRCGPAHGRRLAEMLDMDKSSVSRQVTAMESLGLVEREADPADGRAYFLVASDDARKRIAEMRTADQAVLRAQLRNWADEDVPKFAELLARINEIEE